MRIKNVIQYGLARLRQKDASTEYTNWLEFANAGMLNKGNIHAIETAVKNMPDEGAVVEIGSFCGLSTNLMSHFLEKYNRKNKIFCSDKWIFVGSEDEKYLSGSKIEHKQYREFVKESFIRNVKFFSPNNIPFTIEEFSDDFFELWNNNTSVTDLFKREIKLGGNISFAYIDGNHTYEYTKRDFMNTDKNMKKGGFILFDDSADYYNFGSAKFMKEMKKNKNYELIIKNPNYLFKKI